MSASRYPDNNRYPRDRSPFRDRRPSTYGSGYPPRGSESNGRPSTDSSQFPPRDVPRGPKSLVDSPRGPPPGPPPGVPSGPRESRGRGFTGRGDGAPSLRDAPPLTSTTHVPRDHNTRDHWRADRERDRDRERERDRDRDFRDRRPSPPPRRSPIRDSRDFVPRDLDINRARRNSRDGPPSAGSNFSDPPLGSASSYRGTAAGRGRGTGRDFPGDFRGGRGRPYHNDERERHHDPRDPRDRMPDRTYRPRSRSRDPVRRDTRDDREFDRRDREERRFDRRDDEPRRYDSYIGSASTLKTGLRPADTHRGSTAGEPRNIPGTPTGPPTPHATHHPASGDRLGHPVDSYSRRSSIVTEPLSAKEARRESDRNDLLASRAEASRERYAPRASSPPAAVPAFGFSNVWRNPLLDTKSTPAAHAPKPIVPVNPAPAVAPTPSTAPPAPPPATKPVVPPGLSTAPPTGPKADRVIDRPQADNPPQEPRPLTAEQPRVDPPPPRTSVTVIASPPAPAVPENVESKPPPLPPAQAASPPAGPAVRNRAPPTGPQAAIRQNTSPSYPRPQQLPFVPRDASPGAIPSGPRNVLSLSTSPQSTPINIPTGPKADRTNLMTARPPMYAPPDRQPFPGQRLPLVAPKSMQWVRPGLNRGSTIPNKREYPADDRDRAFGTIPKAPKLEGNSTAMDFQRPEQPKPEGLTIKPAPAALGPQETTVQPQPLSGEPAKPTHIETRRMSDVSMPDVSPRTERQPKSAASSAPEAIEEDSDDDLDLDEDDFAESEAKYNRERALLESKRIDLSAPHLRVTTILQEIMMLSSLSLAHLPRQESKPVEEEITSPPPLQPPPEVSAPELLTPKAEEPEDIVMEDKDEKPLAPATRALRLRRESSTDREITPDLSSLPYLGSGPPTPLSDPDHDRPSVSDSVILAIRTNLRKEIVPELEPGDIMRQYAAAYRNWRLYVRDLDGEREVDDPERLPSAEPGLKATTPDVQPSVTGPLSESLAPTTGRRAHTSRWASEFDYEQAIKESLKTAEEERLGKKEPEPNKSLADPEREAPIPQILTDYESQRRKFIDTNFQREPGQGVFVYHYEPPDDDFTVDEHRIMVQHYRDQYAKKWGKLAEIIYKEAGVSRTYKDTINHYYATKWAREYKGKARRRTGGRKRGGASARGRVATANVDRPENQGEDGTPLPLTDSGRPRRSAAPTFGMDTDMDSSTASLPGRLRRQTDLDGTSEKPSRRGGRVPKEKSGRKPKNQPAASVPAPAPVPVSVPSPAIGSPIKSDRKERPLGVKMEEEPALYVKRPIGEAVLPVQPPTIFEEQMLTQSDSIAPVGLPSVAVERARSSTTSRPGPSSYWSVTEQNDFQRYVAHFGTDWAAIAGHMGTKTQTMVKNQYLRLTEGGSTSDLARLAMEADQRRERGEDIGPPPTPTPAVKRRYEPTPTIPAPRALAPTPDVASIVEAPKSPPMSKMSPPQAQPTAQGRFSTIVQAPQQPKPVVPNTLSTPLPESPLAAIPSGPSHQSPPTQPPRIQPQHQSSQVQHKQHPHGPRAGYFSDDVPPPPESRPPSQSSMVPPRAPQQHIQPHTRAPEQPQPSFRGPLQQEREPTHRLEPEIQARFQPDHKRHVSQDVPFSRPYQSAQPPPMAPQMRSGAPAGSPEVRPSSSQQPRHTVQMQPRPQHMNEPPGQPTMPMGGAPSLGARSVVRTPPVKEEPRHYPMPTQAPQIQTPQIQAPQIQPPLPQPLPQNYPHPNLPNTNVSSSPMPLPAALKPPVEPRKKSNLLSLLNEEPEEPRRKKPSDIPSHTSTPQQQVPIAAPPSAPQNMPPRRELYHEANPMQPSYPRSTFPPPPSHSQPPSSSVRQMVDMTNEQSAARSQPRPDWAQQRSTIYPPQSQPQQTAPQNPSHLPNYMNSHRSVFSQHNAPRHNPSPPPPPSMTGYRHSPHMHSRTPSVSGPPAPQSHHGSNTTSAQQANASQVLQPNPYTQVEPPGGGSHGSVPHGMRPSPHHSTSHNQARDLQGRNDQQHAHNANLGYSNPSTPSELHMPLHMRGPSMEHYGGRDSRDPRDPRDPRHDFDPRNHERDVGRELSQRAEVILRGQQNTLNSRTGLSQQGPPEPRYSQPIHSDRGYPVPRTHTPQPHVYHPSYMTNQERDMREQDPRYRDEMVMRENMGRLPPGPPVPPPGPDQRHTDWVSAVPQPQHREWPPR
ncbi:hypothetical protein B0J11DRAFT_339348 [Dendryphion nanum]|uniref:Myb-like domain-containing protein n=1 Tax=Dendryphion nanum TaxID=256645 RepID=A0A9P9DP06_9PLEO|nr:hypothetical protein B0J11DRAFT_339348 [Dendryphion nanum]